MTDKTMVKVLPRMVEEWIGMEDICFITGKIIGRMIEPDGRRV